MPFQPVEKRKVKALENAVPISTLRDVFETGDFRGKDITNTGSITARTPIWYHEHISSAASFAPGASGATWTDPSASTLGGYNLDANTEKLFFHGHVEDDWSSCCDIELIVWFEVNVDNTGGADEDTVDLKCIFYYKGIGDTDDKTQTVEVATTVGKSAQYKLWKAAFTIDWDVASNVVEKGSIFAMTLNLETDTSEVDNVIIVGGEFRYRTKYPLLEA